MRAAPLLVIAVVGCVAAPKGHFDGIPTLPRQSFAPAVWRLASDQLAEMGFDAELAGQRRETRSATERAEEWDEEAVTLDFTARKANSAAPPVAMTGPEMAALLAGLRGQYKRLLKSADAEVFDPVEAESHGERSLILTYKLPKAAGVLRMRLAPAGATDEPAMRLEVTLRESPLP